MSRFIVKDDFWTVFPQASIGVIVCSNIDNRIQDQNRFLELIRSAEKEAKKYLIHDEFSSNPVVRVWRDAFVKFKTKKGARSSIEALLKRVYNGNPIGTINPLVDLYNSVSLKYALPCGGEDIDKFAGDLFLTKADGDEHFVPLGTDENSPPYEGEIVYKDGEGAVCRCWNWREAKRTILSEHTRNAFLCIELVDQERGDVLQTALHDLAASVQDDLKGTCRMIILDRNCRETEIS